MKQGSAADRHSPLEHQLRLIRVQIALATAMLLVAATISLAGLAAAMVLVITENLPWLAVPGLVFSGLGLVGRPNWLDLARRVMSAFGRRPPITRAEAVTRAWGSHPTG